MIIDQSAMRERLRRFPNVLGETAVDAAAELLEWDAGADNAGAGRARARALEAAELIENADLEDEFYCDREGTGAMLQHQSKLDRSWNDWSTEQHAAADRIAELDNEAAEEIINILQSVNLDYSSPIGIRPAVAADGTIPTADPDNPYEEYEVNDHGNVTYRILDVEVWACV